MTHWRMSVAQTGTPDDSWRELALCANSPVNDFFPAPDDIEGTRKALSICAACPVRESCLADALAWPPEMDHGIRGGKTAEQREGMRRGELLDTSAGHPGHGDYRGYLWEIRHRGEACESCKEGLARYYGAVRAAGRIVEGDGDPRHGSRRGYRLGCRGDCCGVPEREYQQSRDAVR